MRPVKSMVVSKAEKGKNRGNGTRLLSFRKHLNKNGKPLPPTSNTCRHVSRLLLPPIPNTIAPSLTSLTRSFHSRGDKFPFQDSISNQGRLGRGKWLSGIRRCPKQLRIQEPNKTLSVEVNPEFEPMTWRRSLLTFL